MKTFVKHFCSKRAALGLALLAATMPTQTYGDGGSIGDLPGYGEDTYFADDAAYDESTHQPTADAAMAADAGMDDMAAGDVSPVATVGSGYYEPIDSRDMAGNVEAVGFFDNIRNLGRGGESCDSMMMMNGSCDSYGCDSSCGSSSSLCQGNTWATLEALLWFVEDREPGLLAFGFDDDSIDADEAIFERLDSFDSGLAPGFRADAGVWMTDNVGIGGRYTQIFDGSESGSFDVDDSRGIAVPFFDPDFGDDLFLIRADGIRDGDLRFDEEVDFWMAEAYGRLRFSGAKQHSLDLIGGYTHMQLDNSLQLTADSITTVDTIFLPLGTREFFQDQFETENVFNGGQVGFEAVITRGRWMARSLTKVHLGNMNQSVSRFGVGSRTEPGFAAADLDGGIFGPGERETVERDVFAFIPEANFKLGFCINKNAYVTAGYSFLYLDNVATTQTAFNPIVSPPGAPFENGPALTIQDDSLYVHGVDVGLVLDF